MLTIIHWLYPMACILLLWRIYKGKFPFPFFIAMIGVHLMRMLYWLPVSEAWRNNWWAVWHPLIMLTNVAAIVEWYYWQTTEMDLPLPGIRESSVLWKLAMLPTALVVAGLWYWPEHQTRILSLSLVNQSIQIGTLVFLLSIQIYLWCRPLTWDRKEERLHGYFLLAYTVFAVLGAIAAEHGLLWVIVQRPGPHVGLAYQIADAISNGGKILLYLLWPVSLRRKQQEIVLSVDSSVRVSA